MGFTFDILQDAFEFTKQQLGINFYISLSIKNQPLEFDIARHPSILCQNCISKSQQLSQLTTIIEELLKQVFEQNVKMSMQQNLLQDRKSEIQTFRTQNEALKPTSSEYVFMIII